MKQKFSFNLCVAKKYLKPSVYKEYLEVLKGEEVTLHFIKSFSLGLKKWADDIGVKYYAYWFMPLTNKPAVKFVKYKTLQNGKEVDNFSYKSLLLTETDASSFPSFGERDTSKARGYIIFDATSTPFIKEQRGGKILYLPSFFCSHSGTALDYKLPLYRSNVGLNKIATKLVNLLGLKCDSVLPYLGIEQEFFLLDKSLADRQDILLTGRAIFSNKLLKGQENVRHYFGEPSQKIIDFTLALEKELVKLNIDLTVFHQEVAQNQFEVVPKFCEQKISVDNNMLLMQTIKDVADRFQLVAIFHEKPFAGINGSGKHNNWSLITSDGDNLFDCKNIQIERLFKVAVISAIHEYDSLLRISAESYSNSLRLGGSEAPPSIISVYSAADIFEDKVCGKLISSGLPKEGIYKQNCDRNRTSPFAFTGNKWEFRMLGSSCNCGFANTVLNTILIKKLTDYYKALTSVKTLSSRVVDKLIESEFNKHQGIVYNGDNYCKEWQMLAKERGLFVEQDSIKIFDKLTDPKIVELFCKTKVLTSKELFVLCDSLKQNYYGSLTTEANVVLRVLNDFLSKIDTYLNKNISYFADNTKVYKSISNNYLKLCKLYLNLINLLKKDVNLHYKSLANCIAAVSLTFAELSKNIPDIFDFASTNKLLEPV